jgi:hypothetical protein
MLPGYLPSLPPKEATCSRWPGSAETWPTSASGRNGSRHLLSSNPAQVRPSIEPPRMAVTDRSGWARAALASVSGRLLVTPET